MKIMDFTKMQNVLLLELYNLAISTNITGPQSVGDILAAAPEGIGAVYIRNALDSLVSENSLRKSSSAANAKYEITDMGIKIVEIQIENRSGPVFEYATRSADWFFEDKNLNFSIEDEWKLPESGSTVASENIEKLNIT